MAVQPGPTKTYHLTTYDSISPTLPALSQKGKNVIITGGGTGIGQAIALSFAKASVANLALLGRRLKPLEDTKSLINTSYPNVSVHVYTADVADEATLNEAFSAFAQAAGGVIHTLIANAGVLSLGKVLDTDTESFMKSLETNALVKSFVPHIPTEPDNTGFRARIIHTSSAAVQLDFPYNMNYTVGKLAGAKIMQHVAAEHPDVFVLNYHPGTVATPMNDIATKAGFEMPKDDGKYPLSICYLKTAKVE
ncbi:hypothetical protein LTR70_007129 [Exophiala xenobiotica]|uniref:Ketoreductase domain-containing protein n=1 Tax=Lithohypha guttulata TaxID=1690604 RepID=A0ABR0K6C1_9EURO|nr:hypothetical protein LTR24_006326 [Lithohypha guttulata]KAK5314500.1 hypothetical protein LTR70_007129 [Exophiala xenobiotica]